MRLIATSCLLLALAACSRPAQDNTVAAGEPAVAAPAKPLAVDVPAGAYTLDKSHSTLLFRVNHMGFSSYTAGFERFDAQLQLDPAKPETASVVATIDANSLKLPSPPPGFEAELRGPQWMDTAKYPQISFRSTKVEPTSADTARITGDFTLHGVTRPVVLEAKFNGGYVGHPMDPHARIGLSAKGTFKRAEFGIGYGVPAAGSKMGVSDEVDVVIETEFSGPAWVAPAQKP